MAEPARFDLAAILSGASALAGAHPFAFATSTIVYVAFGTWIEMQPGEGLSTMAAMTLASTVIAGLLQYLVLRRFLGAARDRGRIRALLTPLVAVAIYCLIWLAAGFALLLFLLPGLYLAGRLAPAAGIAVAEREWVLASLVASWRRTRVSWWPLMVTQGILLLPIIGMGVLVAAAMFLEWMTLHTNERSLELALASNLLFGVMNVAGWAVNAAAYRLTAPDSDRDEDIFA